MARNKKARRPSATIRSRKPMYRGRKGPSIGYLKVSMPRLRDGDRDGVVGERPPKVGDKYIVAKTGKVVRQTRRRRRPVIR